jgi:hypothetical protein
LAAIGKGLFTMPADHRAEAGQARRRAHKALDSLSKIPRHGTVFTQLSRSPAREAAPASPGGGCCVMKGREMSERAKSDQRRERAELDARYGKIGISAVAAALRYQSDSKNPVYAPAKPGAFASAEEAAA